MSLVNSLVLFNRCWDNEACSTWAILRSSKLWAAQESDNRKYYLILFFYWTKPTTHICIWYADTNFVTEWDFYLKCSLTLSAPQEHHILPPPTPEFISMTHCEPGLFILPWLYNTSQFPPPVPSLSTAFKSRFSRFLEVLQWEQFIIYLFKVF